MPKGGRATIFGDNCKKCSIIITEQNCVFYKNYLRPYCIECQREYNKESERKRRMDGRAKIHNLNRYNLTVEEFDKKYELQLGGCAICKQPCKTGRRLTVDHDHRTGQTRDLLCVRCNTVLGAIHEDEGLLFAMMEYLKRHSYKLVS